MDELEAIKQAHIALESSEMMEWPQVAMPIEAFRILLDRAERPHD